MALNVLNTLKSRRKSMIGLNLK